VKIGQVLLTEEDFSNWRRYSDLRRTMEKLIGFGVLPIVNENDTVSTAELETVSDNSPSAAFSDNDRLAALVMSGRRSHSSHECRWPLGYRDWNSPAINPADFEGDPGVESCCTSTSSVETATSLPITAAASGISNTNLSDQRNRLAASAPGGIKSPYVRRS
jgi:hypothetical protein